MTRPGALEEQIMNILWNRGEATVRQVLEHLSGDLAYTTVMTVLDRLHHKEQVTRRKVGIAWSYQATAPRAAVLGQRAAALLTGSAEKPEPLLMAFLDRTEAEDPAVLDELERLIRKRRARRDRGR